MANQPEPMISKEEFENLDVPEKLDTLFEVLQPMADLYYKSIIIQRFGVGLGGIVFSIIIFGEGIIQVFGFLVRHFWH